MPSDDRRSPCPVTFALDRFGDKWSLLVVRDMLFRAKETYGDLLESADGIATNVLADRLKRLEMEGIIEKRRDPENGRRVLYRLTDKGLDLAPVLVEMMRWSGKYDPDTGASKEMLERLEQDREGVVTAIQEALRRI